MHGKEAEKYHEKIKEVHCKKLTEEELLKKKKQSKKNLEKNSRRLTWKK